MHIVYIMQNSHSKEIYYGVTANLKQRLAQHNQGGQKATTRKNGSWELVYAEAYKSRTDAILRERRLKQHGRAIQEIKRRIANSLSF